MLQQWILKQKIDVDDMLRKGTVALITTFVAGLLFGKENMMIAFVMALGANIYDRENLRVKTLQKILRLILRDTIIVTSAFIASQNIWWGIPINLITIFIIIYTLVFPYDQISYKTFMMLYVFAQYSAITLSELPNRILLVVFALGSILGSSLIYQMRNKAILDPNLGKAWELINLQLNNILKRQFDPQLNTTCSEYMNEVAHTIYMTGYKRYFTTQKGKVQFHFYVNISYFNVLLEQIHREYERGRLGKKELQALIGLTETVDSYFKREIKRDEVIRVLGDFINSDQTFYGFEEELMDMIYAIYKNFKELDELNYKRQNKLYDDWERINPQSLKQNLIVAFDMKSMGFNFATRLSIILTISLLLAHLLGFYKVIWAIIPIMSITRPYYEDTMKRREDRFKSNLLACIILGVVINFINIKWIVAILLILGFYLVYAFKDYYSMSFFLTIISMCMSSFSMGINVLIFYRIIYLVVGITIVELSTRVLPYKIEDGVRELIKEIDRLNDKLEKECLLSLEGKENPHIIRESIIQSALLCQNLYLRNKAYKDEKIDNLINVNTEFVIRLGHKLLSQKD